MTDLLASIPSPDTNTVELGPLTIRLYGIMLVAGIIVAVLMMRRLWVARGGDPDLVYRAAMWGVLWGIVGARAYHVITSWDEVPDEWWGVFAVWKGGLGIWGGVAAGVTAGAIVARRRGVSVRELADVAGPSILAAQCIGRWGNYFNQELFGKPTDLPWAVEIDPEHRPDAYASDETFHPTFLYESIWNAIGVGLLLWIDRKRVLRPGGIFCLYVMWYSLGRAAWEEQIRIDPSHEILGMRLNGWIAIGVFLLAFAGLVLSQRGGRGRPAPVRTAG